MTSLLACVARNCKHRHASKRTLRNVASRVAIDPTVMRHVIFLLLIIKPNHTPKTFLDIL